MYKKITYHIVEEHFDGESAASEKMAVEMCGNTANTITTITTTGPEVPVVGLSKS
jgi:hypothetical protein